MGASPGATGKGRVAASRSKCSLLHRLTLDPLAVAGAVILLAVVLAAVFAPYVAPHDPQEQVLERQLRPPMWQERSLPEHPLGTDDLGRDILSNIIYGLRISLLVGVVSASVALALGVPLGLISGYFRGRVDTVIMRLADMQLSLPAALVALAVMAIWGRGLSKIVLVIGIVHWATYARTVRGSTISLVQSEFVEAARALGASHFDVIVRHVFPNVMTPVVVLTTVQIPRFIMLEATLSFLGLGLPLTVPSLGLAISRGYAVLFSGYWWLSILPGLALMLIVLSINVIGDWLRDALDVRSVTR